MNELHTKVGMKPPHAGAFIRDEILTELNLSIAQAVTALGVCTNTLSDLIDGEGTPSTEMASLIEKILLIKKSVLLSMPDWYNRFRPDQDLWLSHLRGKILRV